MDRAGRAGKRRGSLFPHSADPGGPQRSHRGLAGLQQGRGPETTLICPLAKAHPNFPPAISLLHSCHPILKSRNLGCWNELVWALSGEMTDPAAALASLHLRCRRCQLHDTRGAACLWARRFHLANPHMHTCVLRGLASLCHVDGPLLRSDAWGRDKATCRVRRPKVNRSPTRPLESWWWRPARG